MMERSRKSRRARFARDGLHFFTIRARPRPGTKLAAKYAGAYVNCWINFRLHEGALALAKYYIRVDGWQVRAVTEHFWINGPARLPRESLRYFREARSSGACFVYHRYPIRKKPKRT